MIKALPFIAAAVIGAALVAAPADARQKHARSCYDYAWDSQDQKDCLANPDAMKHKAAERHGKKHMHHEKMHKKGMAPDKG